MERMNKKLLITDIGGTIVKTDEAIISTIKEVFEKNNVAFGSKEELLKAFGVSIYDYILNFLPMEEKEKAPFLYQEFKKIFPKEKIDLLRPFEDVDETLLFLKNKGIKIAIISCMRKEEVEANLSVLKFKDFDIIFSIEDYNEKRPSPQGLLKICKKLGFDVSETVYVGDSVNDIKMAKNANIFSIAVKTGAQDNKVLEEEKPDVLVDSIKELRKYF
jgi:HAD superfamily hydrolase (TIGR01509 family)